MKRLTQSQEAAVKGKALTPRRAGLCGGAVWISSAGLKRNTRFDIISQLRLPAYSPGLNPQENIWQNLRQNAIANREWSQCVTS
jgi:hypothetical protein